MEGGETVAHCAMSICWRRATCCSTAGLFPQSETYSGSHSGKVTFGYIIDVFDISICWCFFSSLSEILLYDLSSDGCLSPCHHGNLTLTRPSDSSEPWSCAIDSLDRLWLYQSVQTEPLLCYHLTIDKVGMYQ